MAFRLCRRTMTKLPSQKILRECFRYEPETGKLFWKSRPRYHFGSARGWNVANSQHEGKEAFTCTHSEGYKQGSINLVLYFAHRVIWKLMTGKDPIADIDHKDRNRANNKWVNLREANRAQNNANSVKRSGVTQHPNGSWRAYISGAKYIHLGYFSTKVEALAARRVALVKQFGEFAP